jgi:hypothetical protein
VILPSRIEPECVVFEAPANGSVLSVVGADPDYPAVGIAGLSPQPARFPAHRHEQDVMRSAGADERVVAIALALRGDQDEESNRRRMRGFRANEVSR